MRKLFFFFRFVASIALFFPMLATAADYNRGLIAFKKKDYATAFRNWKPLAEKGNIKAQSTKNYSRYFLEVRRYPFCLFKRLLNINLG